MIRRLARRLAERPALELLERELMSSELSTLLLHVIAERSRQRSVADLLRQYERTPALQPSQVDPRRVLELESAAFRAARQFEPIELSPVAPLGVNRVLGGISQNNCLATIRMSEVLADPTTAMALECARRRRHSTQVVRLCNRSRQLRLQPFEGEGSWPHFGLFSLATAGRDSGGYRFELENLLVHLRFHVALVNACLTQAEQTIVVRLSDFQAAQHPRRLQRVQDEVVPQLRREFPQARFVVDGERRQGRSYYAGLAISIELELAGNTWNLADGGCADWTQRLLNDRKERLMVSGIALERIVRLFSRAS